MREGSIAVLATLAALGLASAGPVGAEEATTPPTLPARAGDPGVFLLRGGVELAGRLVEQGEEGDVLELRSGERVRLGPGVLVGRLAGPDRWDASGPGDPREVRLTTAASTFEGTLVGRAGGAVEVRQRDGTVARVPESELVEATFVSEARLRRAEYVDPGRVRYLAVRKAGALERGQWAVRTSAESALEVWYAPLDWLTVSAGVETPVLYGSPVPPAGYRLDVTGNLRLGPARLSAGATTSSAQGATSVVLHAEGTVGTPAANLTVFAGPPLAAAARLGDFDAVVIGAAGGVRLVGPVRLVAEAWVTPRTDDPEVLGATAIRLVTRWFALDFGGMVASSGEYAPWIAVSTDGRRGSR